LRFHQVLEEEFGRAVGGDARGADHAHPAAPIEQEAVELGEDGVGVEIAAATRREATADAEEDDCIASDIWWNVSSTKSSISARLFPFEIQS